VPKVEPVLGVALQDFLTWSRTNVRPQKQAGYSTVIVATLLGDLTSAQMRLLGELAEVYADGEIRVTMDQNLVFRWVRHESVEPLYKSLAAAGLSRAGAGTLADVTSCPGAESCKLAVTQSRGLGRVLADHLQERDDIVKALPGLDIKISGCPNGCGQHHIATLGFQGSVRLVQGRAVPQYFVMVGGGCAEDGGHFGKVVAKIPVNRLTTAVDRLLDLYKEQRRGDENLGAFFRRIPPAVATDRLKDLAELLPNAIEPEDYIDLGETQAFNPEVMEGECAS
jgi:sulfite reductase beta subunit-like hemoprotein